MRCPSRVSRFRLPLQQCCPQHAVTQPSVTVPIASATVLPTTCGDPAECHGSDCLCNSVAHNMRCPSRVSRFRLPLQQCCPQHAVSQPSVTVPIASATVLPTTCGDPAECHGSDCLCNSVAHNMRCPSRVSRFRLPLQQCCPQHAVTQPSVTVLIASAIVLPTTCGDPAECHGSDCLRNSVAHNMRCPSRVSRF